MSEPTTQQFLEVCQRAIDEDKRCPVCGGWVLLLRNNALCCSSECAEAWRVAIRFLDDGGDKHRIAMAKSYLARPDHYKPVVLEWSRRVLEAFEKGEALPPRNRTYLVLGSKRAEIIRKYRPELYVELTSLQIERQEKRDAQEWRRLWLEEVQGYFNEVLFDDIRDGIEVKGHSVTFKGEAADWIIEAIEDWLT